MTDKQPAWPRGEKTEAMELQRRIHDLHESQDRSRTRITELEGDLIAANTRSALLYQECCRAQSIASEIIDERDALRNERDEARKVLRAALGDAADGNDLVQMIGMVVSQRENARNAAKDIAAERDELVAIRDCIYGLEINDEVFFNDHWLFNCNDCFAWGCSDAERFTAADIPAIEQAHADLKAAGEYSHTSILFICRKRRMRPQGALYPYLKRETWALFDACGEPRPSDFANPVGTDEIESYTTKKELERQASK